VRGRPEAAIEQSVVDTSKSMGAAVFKVAALGVRGFPDRLFFWPGSRIDLVEFKAPNGRLSDRQKAVARQLLAREVEIEVVASFEDAARYILKCRRYLQRLKSGQELFR
jgi:hypothetical protein